MTIEYNWTGGGATGSWGDSDNWIDPLTSLHGVPGSADKATIPPLTTGQKEPVVNSATTVGLISITLGNWTINDVAVPQKMTLSADLTIVGISGYSSGPKLNAGQIVLAGGNLNLQMNASQLTSVFEWKNGAIIIPASGSSGRINIGAGSRLLVANVNTGDHVDIGCDVNVGETATGGASTGTLEFGDMRTNATFLAHTTSSPVRILTAKPGGVIDFTSTTGSNTSGISTENQGTGTSNTDNRIISTGGDIKRSGVDTVSATYPSVAAELDITNSAGTFQMAARAKLYLANGGSSQASSFELSAGVATLGDSAKLYVDKDVVIGGGSSSAELKLTPPSSGRSVAEITDLTVLTAPSYFYLKSNGTLTFSNTTANFTTLKVTGLQVQLDAGNIASRMLIASGNTSGDCDQIQAVDKQLVISSSVTVVLTLLAGFMPPGGNKSWKIYLADGSSGGAGLGSGDPGSLSGGGRTWTKGWQNNNHEYVATYL